jgi:hypothetical protein
MTTIVDMTCRKNTFKPETECGVVPQYKEQFLEVLSHLYEKDVFNMRYVTLARHYLRSAKCCRRDMQPLGIQPRRTKVSL